jgi:hypothetical protein
MLYLVWLHLHCWVMCCGDRPGCWLWPLFCRSWSCVSVQFLLTVSKDRIPLFHLKTILWPWIWTFSLIIPFSTCDEKLSVFLRGIILLSTTAPILESQLLSSLTYKHFTIKAGGFLKNVVIHLQEYMVLQSTRLIAMRTSFVSDVLVFSLLLLFLFDYFWNVCINNNACFSLVAHPQESSVHMTVAETDIQHTKLRYFLAYWWWIFSGSVFLCSYSERHWK